MDVPSPLKQEISMNNLIKNFKAKIPALPKSELHRQLLLALDSNGEEEWEGTNYVSATPSSSSKHEDVTQPNSDMRPDLKDLQLCQLIIPLRHD